MKGFARQDQQFSLCGLKCALCTMKWGGYCPGCGGGEGNQGCAVARCGMGRGVPYCFECADYPCGRYDGITQYDSFITHQNQLTDMARAKEIGVEGYRAQLAQKVEILRFLLDGFNDGRRKTFFSLAVNLLDLDELNEAVQKIRDDIAEGMTAKEKAALAAARLQEVARRREIVLKLRKK